jgi:hypothetical protein
LVKGLLMKIILRPRVEGIVERRVAGIDLSDASSGVGTAVATAAEIKSETLWQGPVRGLGSKRRMVGVDVTPSR